MKEAFLRVATDIGEAFDDKKLLKELDAVHKDLMKMTKEISKIMFCRNIASFLKTKMAVVFTKKVFNIGIKDHYNVNFKNGVFNLKTKTFRKRCFDDYITQWLDYDYIEKDTIDDEIHQDVYDFFQKIQPDKEQRTLTLSFLAYCLTGNTNKQKFKMNVGYTAANGKSTEIETHRICFPIYTKKLNKETFDMGYTKRHKHIADLLTSPIRMSYIEELSKKNLDIDFVKDFVDAKNLPCEIMYGTDMTKPIQAKLMTCSQHDFSGETDAGLRRRGMIQNYTSRFLADNAKNASLFSDENHIYRRVYRTSRCGCGQVRAKVLDPIDGLYR